MKIEIDSLYYFLKENREEIDYVCLNWIWKPKSVEIETNYIVEETGCFVYASFIGKEWDSEYSFHGSIDDAIEYAKNYNQWNEHEIEMLGPVLMATHEEDIWHMDEHISSEESDLDDLIDVDFEGYFYYGKNGKRHRVLFEAIKKIDY